MHNVFEETTPSGAAGESGCNVTTYGVSNACWNEWPTYQDMTFRVTLVMVPPGETFSGWDSYP